MAATRDCQARFVVESLQPLRSYRRDIRVQHPGQGPASLSLDTGRLVLRRFRADAADPLFDYLHPHTVRCFLTLALPDLDAARAE
ncbi:MAG: hypothetical protein INR62_04440, partial [Rhodospirillales bacterium]|nr:hypothetical protein [Acetobacter sp.]